MARYLGDALPEQYINFINTQIVNGVLCTVDEDGYPRTAPVTFIRVKAAKQLLLGLGGLTRMVGNIKRDGKVSLCIVEGGDVALSIRGNAKMIKQPMDCNQYMAVASIDIEEVKSDTSPDAKVVQGIGIVARTENGARFMEAVNKEMNGMMGEGN